MNLKTFGEPMSVIFVFDSGVLAPASEPDKNRRPPHIRNDIASTTTLQLHRARPTSGTAGQLTSALSFAVLPLRTARMRWYTRSWRARCPSVAVRKPHTREGNLGQRARQWKGRHLSVQIAPLVCSSAIHVHGMASACRGPSPASDRSPSLPSVQPFFFQPLPKVPWISLSQQNANEI
jgi:hypothetical protein